MINVSINPIEALKNEFQERYGVELDITVWVHEATTDQAKQIAEDFQLQDKGYLLGQKGRFESPLSFENPLGFDLKVVYPMENPAKGRF